MPRQSSIKRQLPEIKAAIDKLINAGATIQEIVAEVEARGGKVSRSAVGRYKKDMEKVTAKMREAREIAAGFASDLGEIPEGKTGRLLIEMLQTLIFQGLLDRGQDDDGQSSAKDLMMLAKAIRDMASASKIDVDLEMSIRRETAKKAAAEAVKVAKKKGLSKDAINDFREQILGVAK